MIQVALSYLLTYGFAVGSLLLLPLLPAQKADTQARKRSRPRGGVFAAINLSFIGLAVAYSLTTALLTVIPSTSCLEFVGGEGCDDEDDVGVLRVMRGALK